MNTLLLRIIAVGRMKDRHLEAKCAEYLTRLGAYAKAELIEVKDSSPEEEAVKIRRLFDPARDFAAALGEEGKEYTSSGFASLLGAAGRRAVLIIGGPYGLAPGLKKEAHLLLSLSPMTFTHELARLLLLEQLYRAGSILNGSGYHH